VSIFAKMSEGKVIGHRKLRVNDARHSSILQQIEWSGARATFRLFTIVVISRLWTVAADDSHTINNAAIPLTDSDAPAGECD